MTSHYIIIHSDRKVSILSYIATIKTAKENPEAMFKEGLTQWHPVKGSQIYYDYKRSIHERINNKAGESWRNTKTINEIEYERDARALKDWLQKRIICRKLTTKKLQEKFGHLLYKED